jgi:cytosine/adenosine deaminase-related metal-dependent hydrolase
MGTVRHTAAIGQTLTEIGIRAVFGKALMDQGVGVPKGLLETPADALADALALADLFDGAAGGRLRVSLAPRFILSCSDALWRDVAVASAERGLIVHTHLAESPSEGEEVRAAVATTAARYFSTRGVLSERFVGAHGVWLDEEELGHMRRADAALVHCPGSNLKLGSGLASVRAWKRAEVKCGLGSDGAACNNRLDTFHEMSLAAGISRVRGATASARDMMARAATSAPTSAPDSPLTAEEVVALATCDGARALGLADRVGSLEVGKRADIAVVDVSAGHHGPDPRRDPYVALVHSARSADVKLTMVEGRVLYRDGQWTTLDPEAVVAQARAEARGVVRRAESGEAA